LIPDFISPLNFYKAYHRLVTHRMEAASRHDGQSAKLKNGRVRLSLRLSFTRIGLKLLILGVMAFLCL